MSDLLNKLNEQSQTKTAKEDGKSSTSSLSGQSAGGDTLVGNESSTAGVTAGDDLLSGAGQSTKSEGAQDSGSAAKKAEESNAGASKDEVKVQDSGTWTKESALQEVKKLREENKLRRIREKEVQAEYDKKFEDFKTQMQEQMQSAMDAKKELETLKAKEEDKKRTLEEKVAHREAMVADTRAKIESLETKYQHMLDQKESELKELQAQQEAHLAVYRSRIDEELESIPETKRKFANLIVKGYNDGSQDPREAWTALAEARAEGVFEDKQVVVSHATPGADAARMTQEKLEDAANRRKESMTPSQMIGAGLKEIQNRRGKIL